MIVDEVGREKNKLVKRKIILKMDEFGSWWERVS